MIITKKVILLSFFFFYLDIIAKLNESLTDTKTHTDKIKKNI